MNWTVPFWAPEKVGKPWLRRFIDAADRQWGAHRRRREEHRAIELLSAMSDRELKDIGLIRSEIATAVNIVPLDAAGLGGGHEVQGTKWRGVARAVR